MKNKKIHFILFLVIIILVILFFSVTGKAETENLSEEMSREGIIERQLEQLEIEDLDREVDRLNQSQQDIFPTINYRDLLTGLLRGEIDLEIGNIFSSLLREFFREMGFHMDLMGQLLVLGIIGALLRILSDSFTSREIARVANMIVFLLLAVLLLNSFRVAIDLAIETISSMVSFMEALLPVLLSLLVGLGAVTSASIFHPLTYLILTTISSLIYRVVLPLILISFTLQVVNNISDEFNISRMASLFREVALSILTISLSLFLGSSFLQGGVAAVSDSLTLRTAKHLSGKFIPVVGGIFSGALELIVSSSLLIKNAFNLLGFVGIIILICLPVLQLMVMVFIYKLAAAVLQPVGEQRMINIINSAGNNLMIILGVVISVAVMFFLFLAIVAGTANLTVMMR